MGASGFEGRDQTLHTRIPFLPSGIQCFPVRSVGEQRFPLLRFVDGDGRLDDGGLFTAKGRSIRGG